MTAIWGPMGWMTLHSISVAYPASPTELDKAILNQFMDKFGECITCNSCKGHFASMFGTYKRMHPEWNQSKKDLFLAICRMHNTVNRRLDKPLQKSVKECLETLRAATKHTSTSTFRQNYINHVIRNWSGFQSGEGMIMVGAARTMAKINTEYWNPRDTSFEDTDFVEDNVLEFVPEQRSRYEFASGAPVILPGNGLPSVGFKIRGGRLTLGR